jgi:hypothetical protein
LNNDGEREKEAQLTEKVNSLVEQVNILRGASLESYFVNKT